MRYLMKKREFFRAGFQPSVNISYDVTTGIPQTAKSSDVTDLSDIIFPAEIFFCGLCNSDSRPYMMDLTVKYFSVISHGISYTR
jgi:hypothetical protein